MPYHLATPPGRKGQGRSRSSGPYALHVGWVKGFEPSTPGTTIRCSNQLSYTHHIKYGAQEREGRFQSIGKIGTPEGTRTPDPLLRRQLLYPAELQAHITAAVAGTACPKKQLLYRCHLQNRHPRLSTLQMERVMGIEPTRPAWKAGILPLNYTRMTLSR